MFPYRFCGDAILDKAGELLLVGIFVVLHEQAHVLRDVQAQDVFAVDLSVELLALGVVTGEALSAAGEKCQSGGKEKRL